MPKKKKEPAKQTMPPPPRVVHGVKDPILSTGPPKDYEDWKIKNARAKELIMSTLVPGSEPWKIAEPLENASDIWKALEQRYAPRRGEQRGHDDHGEDEAADDKARPGASAGRPIDDATDVNSTESSSLNHTGFVRFWDVQNFYTALPNRDQRLLWAILHGGTPQAKKWFSEGASSR